MAQSQTLPQKKQLQAAVPGPPPKASAPPGATAPQPTPKPTPPMDKQWNCQIDLPPEGQLTVGVHLLAHCEGETVTLDRAQLKIENREDVQYALHLIEVKELTDHKAELVVTPWMAGELKIPNPALTDGKIRVGMGDQSFTVTSVIDPQSNPEGKPFPPLEPMTLMWPIWLWLIVAAFAAVVVGILSFAIRRSIRRKRLLTNLEQHATALSPFNHFNKQLRHLVKRVPVARDQAWPDNEARQFFGELESEFRWFLSRELVIPAMEGSVASVIREFKRKDRALNDAVGRELRVVLRELHKAKTDRVSAEDALQLSELCRTLVDKIVKVRGV